jgi:hypothetical protein
MIPRTNEELSPKSIDVKRSYFHSSFLLCRIYGATCLMRVKMIKQVSFEWHAFTDSAIGLLFKGSEKLLALVVA